MTARDDDTMPAWFRIGARIRGVATMLGFALMAACLLAVFVVPDVPGAVVLVAGIGGFVLLALGMMLTLVPAAPRLEPIDIGAPVRGRWLVLNGPTEKLPSHGTHGQGQTYASDFVFEPAPGDRPRFGEGPARRSPTDFPAFGQELYAPADGVVVSTADGGRDHRSRSSWPALTGMILASFARELAGTRFVLGNNVVLELAPGVYAALGHLQRGSVAVRPGERVRRGQVVGRCGSSGNSSEPHLHFQLMDHPRPLLAAGLPFTFDGRPLPRNEQPIEVT